MLQHKGEESIPSRNTVPFAQRASPHAMAAIYRPARSAMTSGKANTRRWKLRFEPRTAPFVEPLMGWTDGTDTLSQIELDFCSGRGRLCQTTGPQFYRAGSCRGHAGLLPDDAMDIGMCIRRCCGAERWVNGIVIGAVATAALTKLAEWEVWINFLLGVWVLVSPWVLSFSAQTTARWAHCRHRADRRRAGRPEAAVVHASDASTGSAQR